MSKGLQPTKPMCLDFDYFNNQVGKYAQVHGVHVGTCKTRLDINIRSYPMLDEVQKNKLSKETKMNDFLYCNV